jgi:uncharacterized protein YndB with AHSA1/START domain
VDEPHPGSRTACAGGGAVRFESSVTIAQPPGKVFAFLRDKHLHAQEPGSPVLLLEKATPGDVGVGTRFREVVRMLPGVRGEIRSTVSRCEGDRALEEDFAGAGMRGHLAYALRAERDGTRLVQRQTLELAWWLQPLQPLVRRAFARRVRARLDDIAALLAPAEDA